MKLSGLLEGLTPQDTTADVVVENAAGIQEIPAQIKLELDAAGKPIKIVIITETLPA